MMPTLNKTLIDCLDALERGDSVEQIVAQYSDAQTDLQPFLETAVQLTQIKAHPTVNAQTKSKEAFLAQAASMKANTTSKPAWWQRWQIAFRATAVFSMFLFIFFITIGAAAQTALPGDALYDTKLTLEQLQLRLIANPTQKLILTEQQNQKRIDEIQQLLLLNKNESVSFTGFIEQVNNTSITVAGLTILIDAKTVVQGALQSGYWVQITANTEQGQPRATHIDISSPVNEEPDPIIPLSPTATMTATATTTATATIIEEEDTAVPTATATATATNTATPTMTASPTPTKMLTPTATATSLPPTATATSPTNNDDDDDDGSDDDDDGSDDDDDGSDDDDDGSDDDDDGSDDNDDGSDDDDDGSDDDDDGSDDDDDGSDDNDDDGSDDDDDGSDDDDDGSDDDA